MDILDTIRQAKSYLEEQGRVSLRALGLQFGLDDAHLEVLVEELVDVQQVAALEGKVLVWAGAGAAAAAAPPQPVPPAPSGTGNRSREQRGPRDYTPKHLADRILQSKSALEGERKQVTVLFADVQGSMQLAEQVDPEQWHEMLDRFFHILAGGVHRFEGVVNQYTGDGIMALFGAPIAHEDHAHRACYAALHLRDELKTYADSLRVQHGLNFSVRMGINSGEVVVGKIGDDLRMDYTAQGQVVGLAQRMESLAEAGKALLAGPTIDIVEGYFALRDLGETTVKGVDGPVRVAELEGVGRMRTRLDRSRARGLSKFVGRDEEVARLEGALERALAGDGQVVGVMADAGSGKSRLCHEFLERCRARGIVVRTGTGVPHGKATPLEPILEFYREIFGIAREDDEGVQRQKIAGMVAQVAPEELGLLPVLYDFMRVPDPANPPPSMTPDERRHAHLGLVRRFTAARSRQEPAVLVFEDLHWVDPDTEVVIEGMVEATIGTRTLLLTNFRPEYRAGWMARPHYQQISLRPLDAAAAGELLSDWLGPDPSLQGLAELVRDRTGGNPFFMEEVVQAQIDSGALVGQRGRFRLARAVEHVEVPASVQSLLAARIDRLVEVSKTLLQTASVIGDAVAEPLLTLVAGMDADGLRTAVGKLVQSEFLYEAALYPELEYVFKHPLTREVAYASLLRDRRRALHVAVAEGLERLAGGASDARAPLLAHHWEQAGRALEAARWQTRAALRLGGNAGEAVFHWRKVTELLGDGNDAPEARAILGQARARLVYAASRSAAPATEVEVLFEEARRELGGEDSPDLAYMLGSYAVVRSGAGDIDEAQRLATEGLAMARRLDQPAVTAGVIGSCCIAWIPVEFPEAHARLVAELEQVCANDSSLGDALGMRPLFVARATAAMALPSFGRGKEMVAELAALQAFLGDSQNTLERTLFHFLSTVLGAMRGDTNGALEHGRQALAWSVRSHNEAIAAIGQISRGRGLLVAGRLDEAVEHLEQGNTLGVERRFQLPKVLPDATQLLCEAHLRRDDPEAARRVAERGVALAAKIGLRYAEATAQATLGRVRAAIGDAAGAEAALARATELATAIGARDVAAMVAEGRAELARLRADEAGHRAALTEAARLHRANGAEGFAALVEARLDG
jgi:class 3 adenylate cyclase/tetratricopeptide (TPR) repeat protein